MRKNRISKQDLMVVLAAVGIGWASTLAIGAQATVENETLASISKELQPEFGSVRFHRDEQLEDQFIVRGAPISAISGEPKFYEVQKDRFEISDGVVSERFSGVPTMWIAASADGAKVYRLAGFESAEENFNLLVSDSPKQRISTTAEAESRGLLCAEVVYGLSSDWWLDGSSGAQLKAAKHFFAEGHSNGLLLAQRWWRSFSEHAHDLQIRTAKENGAYSVSLPVFWAPVEGHSAPEVRLYRIEVGQFGACHLDTTAPFQTLR
jgi:hypothetical protein